MGKTSIWAGRILSGLTAAFFLLDGTMKLVPAQAVIGAILASCYLGGAVATHVRIGSPLFSHVLFGVYLGAMIWGGLRLRDPRTKSYAPLAIGGNRRWKLAEVRNDLEARGIFVSYAGVQRTVRRLGLRFKKNDLYLRAGATTQSMPGA